MSRDAVVAALANPELANLRAAEGRFPETVVDNVLRYANTMAFLKPDLADAVVLRTAASALDRALRNGYKRKRAILTSQTLADILSSTASAS